MGMLCSTSFDLFPMGYGYKLGENGKSLEIKTGDIGRVGWGWGLGAPWRPTFFSEAATRGVLQKKVFLKTEGLQLY